MMGTLRFAHLRVLHHIPYVTETSRFVRLRPHLHQGDQPPDITVGGDHITHDPVQQQLVFKIQHPNKQLLVFNWKVRKVPIEEPDQHIIQLKHATPALPA